MPAMRRLALAFLASGGAALLFQVLWFRAFGRVLGNTVWAGTLVLSAFMLGMAVGGLLAARWARRIRKPARAFVAAEATVAVAGSLLVCGLPLLEPLAGRWLAPLAGQGAQLAGARLGAALALMLVPTVAMGTTLAFGVRVLARDETTRALGTLYAANTLGACLAPLLAEFYLIGALGLGGTALAAAGLNALAAALAWSSPSAPEPAAGAGDAGAAPAPRLLCAAALAGALALALEVVWFRLLVLHAPASDVTFALMLTVVLLGIAAGGALAPLLARKGLAWVAAASCLAVVGGYALTGTVQHDLLVYAACLMLPAAVFSGALFTLLGAALRADSHNPQPAVGLLTTANTLGAGIGAALAGLVLLPRIGMEASVFVLAAGYALLVLLGMERPRTWRAALPLAAAAAALVLFPFGRIGLHLQAAALPYRSLDGSSSVARVTQGPTTTLQLLRTDRFGEPAAWRLLTDSYSMTAITSHAVRYMQMFAWLPLALHPRPERALLISYGAGNTAQALLNGPELRELTVVDVSPEILGASPLIHGEQDPLADARVRLVMEDGRHFLRTRKQQFDIITAEPPPPLIAGVVNLYTQEYFAALAARLAPGGLATYWLPVAQFEPDGARAVVHAFCNVFPDCTLWAGTGRDWILMGGRDYRYRPEPGHFLRLWRNASGALLARSGLEHPEQLGAAFLADAAQLRGWYEGSPALVDDFPKRMSPAQPGAPAKPDYLAWLDPADAAGRFKSSAWVREHWPSELVEPSLAFFAVQPMLNGGMGGDPVRNLVHVDQVLRHSDLRIPVLWLLGSDVTEQEIVNRRLAATGYQPAYAYPLAVRALAERDYATAARLFGEAAEREPRPAGALAAYALCRDGQRRQAASVPEGASLPTELQCWRGGD